MKRFRLLAITLCLVATWIMLAGCGGSSDEAKNSLPAANASGDHTVQVGDTVYFSGAGADADGEIVKYEWDFNGDGVYDWSSATSGSTTHICNTAGTFTAVIRVTDDDGAKATDSCTITVKQAIGTFDVSGAWNGVWHRSDGKEEGTFIATLVQSENTLSGDMRIVSTTFGDSRDTTVMGNVEGNNVVFGMAITVEGDTVTIDYGGTISDDGTYMEGTYTISTGYNGTWAATTGTATITPPPITTTTPITTQTVAPTPTTTTTTTTAPTTTTTTAPTPTTTTTTTTIQPAAFTVTDLVVEPKEVVLGEAVTISATVTNTGGSPGSYDVVLLIKLIEVETKTVTLDAGAEERVSFSVTQEETGMFSAKIDDQKDSFTVMLPIALTLEVTATTWREEEPYDIYSALEDNLKRGGIKVVTGTDETYNAILYVEYAETKGREYTGGGFGTNIQCNLRMVNITGSTLFEKTIDVSTSLVVFGTTLYKNAINNFLDTLYFRYLPQMLSIEFGFGDEISVLISALEDTEEDVRSEAAEVLGEIGDTSAVEPLITLLLEDEDYSVRSAAAQALGSIGDVSAVSPLSQALFDEDNANVRKAIAKALGEIGDAGAVAPLCQALVEDEDQFVRSEVAGALIIVGNTEAVEPLIQALLNDEYWYVRVNSAKALGEIGDSRAIEPLTQALNDEDELVRNAAQRALEKIQGG